MNTESVVHDDDETSRPLVQWYPRAGGGGAADAVVIAGLALGLFAIAAGVTTALILSRRAQGED
ncbi:MAG TPA: hypothetical protein VF686_03615 [Brevundimonas sp.]|jgi:hypothetical protein